MSFLFNTNQSKYRYVLQVLVLTLCLVTPIAFVVDFIFESSESPLPEKNIYILFSVVILSPLIETYLMVYIFRIIEIFTNKFSVICIMSAFIWGGAHSLFIPTWGLVIFFTFLVYSIAFQVWNKISKKDALIVTASIHALVNLFAYSMP